MSVHRIRFLLAPCGVAVISLLMLACGGSESARRQTATPTASPRATIAPRTVPKEAPPMPISLTSDAFEHEEPIPARFTCDGNGVSPALSWDEPPAATQSFALIMDDPDAPIGVFTHWVIYDIPKDARELPEAVENVERPSTGGTQGRNDSGRIGYSGPCPPGGDPHHYRFELYALDGSLDLRPGASKQEVLDAMMGHSVTTTALAGTYQR